MFGDNEHQMHPLDYSSLHMLTFQQKAIFLDMQITGSHCTASTFHDKITRNNYKVDSANESKSHPLFYIRICSYFGSLVFLF